MLFALTNVFFNGTNVFNTSRNSFSNVLCLSIDFILVFMEFLNFFNSKFLKFLEKVSLGCSFWKAVFNTVNIILRKSYKPLAKVVVFWKLPELLVMKRSIQLRFLGFSKQFFLSNQVLWMIFVLTFRWNWFSFIKCKISSKN